MTADKLPICEKLDELAIYMAKEERWGVSHLARENSAIIEGLVEALDYFAKRKTIDELMQSEDGSDYAGLSTRQRIAEMGRRKRENDAAILAARAILAKVRTPHHPDSPIMTKEIK